VGVVLALAEGLWAGGRNLALLGEGKAKRGNRSPIVMCLWWGISRMQILTLLPLRSLCLVEEACSLVEGITGSDSSQALAT